MLAGGVAESVVAWGVLRTSAELDRRLRRLGCSVDDEILVRWVA